MTGGTPNGRTALLLAAALCLGACNETGDFGRPKPNAWSAIAPQIGTYSAKMWGWPSSPFPLTDDEQELRARAYHFLMPAQEVSIFDTQLKHFARDRLLPPSMSHVEVSEYFEAISNQPDRSPRARYQRLREDAEADRELMGPFVALACRVREADRIRMKAAEHMTMPNADSWQNAADRVAENEALVQWVYTALDERARQYRYALEHLVVETPDRDAIRVERQLIGFDSDRAAMMRCGAVGPIGPGPVATNVPRYTPRPDKPEKPPK